MNILVIGGYGSIGSEVSTWYEETNHNVLRLGREDTEFPIGFKGADLVIHCAGNKYVDRCENDPIGCVHDNVELAFLTAVQAKMHGIKKLVYVSTVQAAFPKNNMAMSKRLAEGMFLQNGYSVIRLVNVKETRGNVLDLWDQQKKDGKPLTVVAGAYRYFMSMGEAVQSIMRISNEPPGLYLFKPKDMVYMTGLAQEWNNPAGIEYVNPGKGGFRYEPEVFDGKWELVEEGGCLWVKR